MPRGYRAIVNCDFCGKEMNRKGSRINTKERGNYCSTACRWAESRGGVIINEEMIETLLQLKLDGWTLDLIAEFFGIGRATVSVLWRKYKCLVNS